jgi:hypothetical protein
MEVQVPPLQDGPQRDVAFRHTGPWTKRADQNAKLFLMRTSSKRRWEFRSAEDVQRFWEQNRCAPERGNGDHYYEERFCLGVYLLALATHGLLSYPLSVEQFEEHVSPDFMMRWPSGHLTGLEVARATEEPLQEKKSAAHKEYSRRKIAVAASGTEPEPVSIPLTTAGWLEGEREKRWSLLFQKAVEKKLHKLRGKAPGFRSNFKPAGSYDLLVYDDTPFIGADRTTILTVMQQWVRKLPKEQPAFANISVLVALDLVFDLGGECRMFPYVEWSNMKPGDRDDLMALAHRVEEAGQVAVKRAIQKHAAMKRTVHFMDSRGRMIKQTPDGRRFEINLLDDGQEVIVKEL